MKGHFCWSVGITATALFCLTFATEQKASAQSGPRIVGTGPQGPIDYSPRSAPRRPGLINPLCGLTGGPAVAAADCDSQSGREWEGTASTDYFNFEPSVISPPNPDIAVGPDDIVTVVNRTISRYPNPNAPAFNNNGGTAPVPYSPSGSFNLPPTSKFFLDAWIGEAALNELCPTQGRSNLSCVIDNASVRYDQMQGRFVVLFTVVDTGLTNASGAGTPSQTTRKASWVLIVSRWAVGCQGTGGGFTSACVPSTTPALPGGFGNTEFFTTPQPPGPSQSNPNSGGVNSNWLIYYGSLASASVSQAGDGLCPSGGCVYGNINDITDLRRGATFANAPTIDCRASAIGDTTKVCYFPSSARLGLDNDNITVVSSVFDDNVPLASRSIDITNGTPAWQGTRIRLFKKAAVYIGVSSVAAVVNPSGPSIPAPYNTCTAAATVLCPGGAQSNLPNQLQGDVYDLWASTNPGGTGVNAVSATPYVTDRTVNQTLPSDALLSLRGLNYEPVHVRGRSLASFNGNGNNGWSQVGGSTPYGLAFTNLLGTISIRPGATLALGLQNRLYLRTIVFSRTVAGTLAANQAQGSAEVNQPVLQGGIPWMTPDPQTITVPQFSNPESADQRAKLTQPSPNAQLPTPFLYVGDDRPHRAISREGHVYDARVASQADYYRFDAATQTSTVVYDIVQKLTSSSTPLSVLNTSWGNGRYYSPMFDVPANVIQYGSISPINLGPYLEKLFVGTTFPPLAPSDPRTFNYGNISGQALLACKGQEPSVSTSVGAYPGLFDMRCGEDAYDTSQAYRNPISGAFTPTDFQLRTQPTGFANQIVPFGIRGGASNDPNNLGMWLYGAYAKGRLASVPGFGQWGTYVAHYPLSFPIRDPYNNLNVGYSDVPPGHPHFTYVQIAKQTEIDPGSRSATTFNPDGSVLRRDMARWVMRAQTDETGITNYLNSTGGIFCSFADVACPGSDGATVTNTTGASTDWRYIEAMYRRGYTKGCDQTNDGQRRFCPDRTLTRGEMAVFIIRGKMNSVFPTVTSGTFTTVTCQPPGTLVTQVGDQFGLFAGCRPYFADVANTHVYFAFIQKLRELRITNGTSLSTDTVLGNYSPESPLKRSELMTFLVRGFFP